MKTAISLFASAGIGDLALNALDFEVLVANELIPERVELFKRNFPETEMFQGDIYQLKSQIIEKTKEKLNGRSLDFALVTPPCQGMSKNGRGKLLSEIKKGNRPDVDPRNLLIFPSLEIINELKPDIVVFENVPEMVNTAIPYNNDMVFIVDIIKNELVDYAVEFKVIEFANYGIPQRRQRLITIATRNQSLKNHLTTFGTLFPKETHSKNPTKYEKPWITVRDTISHIDPLDGKTNRHSKTDKYHQVTALDDKKYWWVSNTKENKSAFDNQCVDCGFEDNPKHGNYVDENGVNKSSNSTPIYCVKCNSLLPRPTTVKDGKTTLMKGFTSAYKRMSWDLPASAITRNFMFVCSDNKIHPSQHRTLSIREAMMLHTISDFNYEWEYADGIPTSLSAIRDAIGESIPPLALVKIFSHLVELKSGNFVGEKQGQKLLSF